jgi:N-acetyl-anhydromuramyl-L-alanine amidase AmpD
MALDWCPFATKRPIVSNNFQKGRGSNQVRAVVLHIAAGSLGNVFPTFNDSSRGASAHFCIGKKGEIEQYVSVNDTAYANGLAWQNNQWVCPHNKIVQPSWQDLVAKTNPNLYTISIEHEGQPNDKWTDEMYQANTRLMVWLAEQFNLKYVAHRTVIGHNEIDPIDKANCPGPNVNFEQIALDTSAVIAAKKLVWMPINTDAALYQHAQQKNLGYPQTDEFSVTVGTDVYIVQVFNLGIVYVKQGDWNNVQSFKKPTGV